MYSPALSRTMLQNWVRILVPYVSRMVQFLHGRRFGRPTGEFPPPNRRKTMATAKKVEAVEIAECATPIDAPKGKIALLRDPSYRSTLQTVLTATGNKSLDNGVAIAQMLRGADLETVYKIGSKELGVSVEDLKKKYSLLNPGQQRMCIGNRVRGAIRKREAQGK